MKKKSVHSVSRCIAALSVIGLQVLLTACQIIDHNATPDSATSATPQTEEKINAAAPIAVSCAAAESTFTCDRRAILAMAGEYAVDFRFEEISALRPDYQLKSPQISKAREFVTVVEDSGRRIVLQHVLVAKDGHVTKHWRQDWEYEQPVLWRYRGVQAKQSWQRETLKPEHVKGRWAQLVWQVDDSPRYAGVGQWQHEGNSSVWSSDSSWRPLPRREHTTRNDYDVMVAINRHEITPTGWMHLQDNLKMDSKAAAEQRYLAREFGANTYTRIRGYDFKAGYEYWQRTQPFWAAVRNAWTERLASGNRIELKDKVDDKSLWLTMFEHAEKTLPVNDAQLKQEVDAILTKYLVLTPTQATAAN